ncbi:MAG: hypothetical protein N2D54_03405 [Chloroflexota bacterium]
MFKPIKWSTFLRDFIVIQIGFALFGLAIALLIQANLGTSPWVILEVALAEIIDVTIGSMIVIMGFIILGGALILKEPIGWGTIANIVSIGFWVDLWMRYIPSITNNFGPQLLMLLAAALVMGMATAIYIGVDGGAGPRDSLMLGVERISGWSLRVARGTIEVLVVILGWVLGGPVGIGTVIFALAIGPSVQWGFKIFKVQSNSSH